MEAKGFNVLEAKGFNVQPTKNPFSLFGLFMNLSWLFQIMIHKGKFMIIGEKNPLGFTIIFGFWKIFFDHEKSFLGAKRQPKATLGITFDWCLLPISN